MLNLTHKKPTTNNTLPKQPKFIETELGTEKLCIECQEYWPLDDEFWFSRKSRSAKDPSSRLFEAACKCCYYIRYKPGTRKGTGRIKSGHERLAA